MKSFIQAKIVLLSQLVVGIGLLIQTSIATAIDCVPGQTCDNGTVPEPGPIGLLILGGVALAVAKRVSRKK